MQLYTIWDQVEESGLLFGRELSQCDVLPCLAPIGGGQFSSAGVDSREKEPDEGSRTWVDHFLVILSCHCFVDREKMWPLISERGSLIKS